ncbi:hypothetical protein [Lysobacter sp. CA199]|uniref:hypothetical protein n=1 Tax=Lysobacter sp. CA199 TaxID=3455608 RepID=UPI003F8CF672
MSTPRGIRNNNPGNIDRSPSNQWQGRMPRARMSPEQAAETRFEVFQAPAWGIRALAILLINYQDKHGLRTITALINRWAPPVENDTNAYAVAVARAVGVDRFTTIDTHEFRYLRPLVEAIIKHENAGQTYPSDVIDEGLRLAGVVKSVATPAIGSPAAVATATALTAGGTAAVVEGIQQILPAVQAVSTVTQSTSAMPAWMRVAVGALVLISVLASGYAFWNMRRRAKAVQP